MKAADTTLSTKLISAARFLYKSMDASRAENTSWNQLLGLLDRQLLGEIKKAAAEIKEKNDFCVVIGEGDLYTGMHLFLKEAGGSAEDWPEMIFTGFGMKDYHYNKLIHRFDEEDGCLCIMVKPDNSLFPIMTYALFKHKIFEKYGQQAADRVYVILSGENTAIQDDADHYGYRMFHVDQNKDGLLLSELAADLLPLAVAGYNIEKLFAAVSRWKPKE